MGPAAEFDNQDNAVTTTLTTDDDDDDDDDVYEHTDRFRASTPHDSSEGEYESFGLSDIIDSDRPLVQEILSRIEQLSDAERSQRQIIVLLSDRLSPILKYHAELISEILRVLPTAENTPYEEDTDDDDSSSTDGSKCSSGDKDHRVRVLAVVVSPKSDANNTEMLAEPFQLDLFDRMNLAEIQLAASPISIQSRLVLDDSWACMSNRIREPRGTDAAKEHYVQMLREECCRMEDILAYVSELSPAGTGPLELQVVMEQAEAELYGVTERVPGKVIFIVSKDRAARPKSVALKTSVHWLDRLFLKAGYSEEWLRSNLIPLYIQLPGGTDKSIEGQRPGALYRGSTLQLTGNRPEEALTRVKVRQGTGSEVLEASVLREIERTKLFEMQAIRKPSFFERLGAMSLKEGEGRVGTGESRPRPDDGYGYEDGDGDDHDEDTNPFL
ncbi:hypothetical protein BGZ95_010933 [Linnemannia exigua]|uniref:Uncharacterized protein n=1 Tax=Linnemannia exigua TaxID=604196 RepID=A0AAD4H5I9_9FUNG|nr:hypothetical protein BGZ95_010933 [Linnemannia exigua]